MYIYIIHFFSNDPVRRSAPSFSSRDGSRSNHPSSGNRARVQHLERPLTAGGAPNSGK